jgi:uncharacterized cupredoxin-like copper-binding protein
MMSDNEEGIVVVKVAAKDNEVKSDFGIYFDEDKNVEMDKFFATMNQFERVKIEKQEVKVKEDFHKEVCMIFFFFKDGRDEYLDYVIEIEMDVEEEDGNNEYLDCVTEIEIVTIFIGKVSNIVACIIEGM